MGKQWGKSHWLGLAVTSLRPDPVVQKTTALDRATIYSTCQVCEKEGVQVVFVLLLYKISDLYTGDLSPHLAHPPVVD